jgi:hypothetical protein
MWSITTGYVSGNQALDTTKGNNDVHRDKSAHRRRESIPGWHRRA